MTRSSGTNGTGWVVLVVEVVTGDRGSGVVAGLGVVVGVVADAEVVVGMRGASAVVPVHAATNTTMSVDRERLIVTSLCVLLALVTATSLTNRIASAIPLLQGAP